MAAPVDTTSVVVNWQNGGKLILETGAGAYLNVLMISPDADAITLMIGRRARIPVIDRGVLQQSRLGSQTPSVLTAKLRAPSAYATGELMKVLLPIPSATQLVPQQKFHLQIPDYPGASAGLRYTLNKCELQQPIDFRTGDGFDFWNLTWVNMEEMAEPARYAAELS